MKANFKLASFLAGSTLVALAPVSNAAAKYWDSISPATSGADGGSGTWDTTTNNWRTAPTGGSQVTYGTGGQQAAFNNPALGNYTVTVSGTVQISGNSTAAGSAGIFAADPTVGSSSHPYTFDGNGTIQLTAASFIHAFSGVSFGNGLTIDNNGQALTFSNGSVVEALITGSGSLTKGGGGILKLNNPSNSFSGAVTFTQGTIEVKSLKNSGSNSSLGTGSAITVGTANAGDTQTLRYTGTGGADGTTNRAISLSPTTGTNAFTLSLDQSGSGLVTFSGGISSSTNSVKTLNLTGSSSGTGEISGAITNGSSGSVALTKSGSGTWTLSSGSNTFTGGTSINAGTLQINHANALGTSGTIAFGGGTLKYGSGITTDLSSRFSTAASQAYKINTNGNDVNLGTALTSSGGSLTKSGTGTLTITSPTYSGATTIDGGKLVINGNVSTDMTAKTGGTLGGTFTTTGALTVESGGTLAPGNSIGYDTALGVNFNSGSTFAVEINSTTQDADRVTLTGISAGVLTITNGALLTLGELGTPGDLALRSRLTLIDYLAAGAAGWNGGKFTFGANLLDDGEIFSALGYQFAINYDDTSNAAVSPFGVGDVSNGGTYVTLTVVPEPGATLIGSLGILMLLRRRRA